MGTVVIELTNRCNLSCGHWLAGRHGGGEMLPPAIFAVLVREAAGAGFGKFSFTGGEPTLHPQLGEILRMTYAAGCRFGMVTNGWTFPAINGKILAYADRLSHITLSLDGARRETHDALRGPGSFDRLMKACSIGVATGIPFTVNMTVNGRNRGELGEAAGLVQDLGGRGLRFGPLMITPESRQHGLDLSPEQLREAAANIRALAGRFALAIGMAPGFAADELFPCDPLAMREMNVDCRGSLTKCCHLSGHPEESGAGDRAGRLGEESFAAGFERLRAANEAFRAAKIRHQAAGFSDLDDFPCWYCAVAHGKAGGRPSD